MRGKFTLPLMKDCAIVLIDILQTVIIALISVIITLAGVIKFYLPRHDKAIHNPVELEAIRQQLEKLNERMLKHNTETMAKFQELVGTMNRIEGTLTKMLEKS